MTIQESLFHKTLEDLSYWRKDYSFKRSLLAAIERQFARKLRAEAGADDALRTAQAQQQALVETLVEETVAPPQLEPEDTHAPAEVPPGVKRVYREIVKRSHPDKTGEASAERQAGLHKIYIAATAAHERREFPTLLLLAKRLRIPLDVDKPMYEQVRAEVGDLQQRSAYIENSWLWRWYHAPAAERRVLLTAHLKKELGS